jgi:predicted permease
MRSVLYDLRYALRNLLRSPGFAGAALLTLGIGTGANATVFTFVNALLLRPVPGIAEPSSVVSIYTSDFSSGPYGDSSYPDFLTLKSDAGELASLAAYDQGAALLKVGDAVERVRRMGVSPEFFDLLGVKAVAGRMLTSGDYNVGAGGAVISHALWRRAFDADPTVIGRSITVDGVAHTIVGVAPESFTGLSIFSFDVWVPLSESITPRAGRGDRGVDVIGRLRDGAGIAALNGQVTATAARLAREYPDSNLGTLQNPTAPRAMIATPHTRMPPSFRGQVAALSGVLMGAVLLVLLISCANVASLVLARATGRMREVAIRLAIGASRVRVAQQMLIESLLLGAAGCLAGVFVAIWTADLLPSFFPAEQARLLDAVVDLRVFAYTAAISVVAALLFGMAPALQAFRTPSTASLRATAGETAARGRGRLRRSLIAAQVALATVLLVAAGLLVQTLVNSLRADLGFRMRDALFARIELPDDPEWDRSLGHFHAVLGRVRALPGVESATLTSALPLAQTSRRGFRMEGYEPRQGEDREFPYLVVDPSYFETFGIDILEGRTFDAHDSRRGARVAVVNALFAERYYNGRAVGRRLTDSRGTVMQVIGVVRTGPYRTVQEIVPMVYYALEQAPPASMTLVVRSAGDPMRLSNAVRSAVLAESPDAAVFGIRSLETHVAEALGGERLTASLVATCGSLALLLALVGIYGAVSYAVGTRTREIGLRVALGAAPAAIVRLVLREGLGVLAMGLVVGVAGAVLVAKLLQHMLFGVSAFDVTTFLVVAGSLVVATILAASLPARRALRVDPVVALRHD